MTNNENYNPYLNASRWARFLAATLDFAIVLIGMLPIVYGLEIYQESVMPDDLSLAYSFFLTLLNLSVFTVVNMKFLKDSGQTIGKRFLRIKVVLLDGTKPPLSALLLKRYGFLYIFPLVPFVGGVLSIIGILMIFGGEKRCLHDRVASTKVISE